MRHFAKRIFLIASATAVLGAAAHAQMPASGESPAAPQTASQPQKGKFRGQPSQRHAQRLDELKTQLKITPAQESAWSQFAQTMQPPAPPAEGAQKDRPQRPDFQRMNTLERLQFMQARRAEHEKRISARESAIQQLYTQLSPEQRQVFDQHPLWKGGPKHRPSDRRHECRGEKKHHSPKDQRF